MNYESRKGSMLTINTVILIALGSLVLIAAGTLVVSAGNDAKDVGDGQISAARCELGKAKYKSACDCSAGGGTGDGGEGPKASNIKQKYVDNKGCEWATPGGESIYDCTNACS